MTREDEFTGQLESYLEEYEGSTPLPDHVRDSVRAQLPLIQQRVAWRPVSKFPAMNGSAKLVIAAAAVLVVAFLGMRLLAGTNVGGPQPTPSPMLTATPGELPAAATLAPGTYFMRNPYSDQDPVRSCERGCSDYRQITFTLPAGWATSDGLVHKHLNQPGEVALSVWTVDMVYADPCHWQGSALSPLDLQRDHTHDESGTIVFLGDGDGGLANQAGRNASSLTQVTLGGQGALRIELSVPAQLDLATCDRGEFRSWTEWDVIDGANNHHASGQIDVVYMVDVDRRALVIDASHMPETSQDDLAELDQILASMRIDR